MVFQPLLACYGLLRVVPFFTSNVVTECFGLEIYWLNLVYILLLRIANIIIKWASLKQGTYYKFNKNRAHCNFDCKYAQVLLLVPACFCSFPLLVWTVFPGVRGRNIFLARPDKMSDSAITLQGIFLFYQTFCNKPNGNIIHTN